MQNDHSLQHLPRALHIVRAGRLVRHREHGRHYLAEHRARRQAAELQHRRRGGQRPGCHLVRILHAQPGGQHAAVRAAHGDDGALASQRRRGGWIKVLEQGRIVGQCLGGREVAEMCWRVEGVVAERQRVAVVSVLSEHDKGAQLRRNFPQEAGVTGE